MLIDIFGPFVAAGELKGMGGTFKLRNLTWEQMSTAKKRRILFEK